MFHLPFNAMNIGWPQIFLSIYEIHEPLHQKNMYVKKIELSFKGFSEPLKPSRSL
jgi:hypothetical protein